MITIDNTAVEKAFAKAAPLHEQAHELALEATSIESMALAAWYQHLLRQVIRHNVSPKDTMPWGVRRTSNCFVDTSARFVPPLELYIMVEAGWLDWLNTWIDAPMRYHRDLINEEAGVAFECWRSNQRGNGGSPQSLGL